MLCDYGCGKEARYRLKKGSNYNRAKKLSAQMETSEVESVKFGETLTDNADGNPEPSPKGKV